MHELLPPPHVRGMADSDDAVLRVSCCSPASSDANFPAAACSSSPTTAVPTAVNNSADTWRSGHSDVVTTGDDKVGGFCSLQGEPPPPPPPPALRFSRARLEKKKKNDGKKPKRKWTSHHLAGAGGRGQGMARSRKKRTAVFCDLDGCLADFNAGVLQLIGVHPHSVLGKPEASTRMWEAIERDEEFYASLPWMADGQQLWRFLVHETTRDGNAAKFEEPVILTGLPRFVKKATDGKRVCLGGTFVCFVGLQGSCTTAAAAGLTTFA